MDIAFVTMALFQWKGKPSCEMMKRKIIMKGFPIIQRQLPAKVTLLKILITYKPKAQNRFKDRQNKNIAVKNEENIAVKN